jgi:hypothetical protein
MLDNNLILLANNLPPHKIKPPVFLAYNNRLYIFVVLIA